METIAIACQKGGPGKTTLAAHLAVAAEISGYGPVVLIDLDEQASLADWWDARESETPYFVAMTLEELPDKLQALAEAGCRLAIIDTPPAITEAIAQAITAADFVLIPTRPSPHDLRAVGRTIDLVRAAGRQFAFAITQAKAGTLLVAAAAQALAEYGDVAPYPIHDRVDFAASMVNGQTVLETNQKGKSAAEIRELWSFVKARLNVNKKPRK